MSRSVRSLVAVLIVVASAALSNSQAQAGPFVRVVTAPARFTARLFRPLRRGLILRAPVVTEAPEACDGEGCPLR